MEKTWCPIMNGECRTDCEWLTDDEVHGDSCSIRKIAERLAYGSIGITTYAEAPICVVTDEDPDSDCEFRVHCY